MPNSADLEGVESPNAFAEVGPLKLASVFEKVSSAEAAALLQTSVFLKAIESPGLRPGSKESSLLIRPPMRSGNGIRGSLTEGRFFMTEAGTLTVDEKPVRFEVAAREACREASKDPAPVIWGSTADLAARTFVKSREGGKRSRERSVGTSASLGQKFFSCSPVTASGRSDKKIFISPE
ncbi:hypothetical protein [Streptomyces sp. NPDC051657]|uniref:hypothetical protein n=1 Tax=unclassified Streptomyces TaxID=2593676 RepID=UPI0034219A03